MARGVGGRVTGSKVGLLVQRPASSKAKPVKQNETSAMGPAGFAVGRRALVREEEEHLELLPGELRRGETWVGVVRIEVQDTTVWSTPTEAGGSCRGPPASSTTWGTRSRSRGAKASSASPRRSRSGGSTRRTWTTTSSRSSVPVRVAGGRSSRTDAYGKSDLCLSPLRRSSARVYPHELGRATD